MAGMLPGVECARRRRFHQSGDTLGAAASASASTRRSSFCLYTSNHESSHSSVSSSLRTIINQAYENEKLGRVARQAKERLDERLRTHSKSASKRFDLVRHETCKSLKGEEGKSIAVGEMQTEVYDFRRNGSKKKFNWGKLSWKASDQDECTVCLERFKSGETLLHLPCAHRFHCRCLVPWLDNNAHCPCCRMEIHVEFS